MGLMIFTCPMMRVNQIFESVLLCEPLSNPEVLSAMKRSGMLT